MEPSIIVAIIAGVASGLLAPTIQAWLNRRKTGGEANLLTAQTARTWQDVYNEQQIDIDQLRDKLREMKAEIEQMETRLEKMKLRIQRLLQGIALLIGQIEALEHEPVWRPADEDTL